ncbi:MAG: hypothetical protein HWN67_05650 [Candidatus Helarchaeota archaeon]|nr:hypothetical protein [Candidatus Helarchaeota archaeon]
MSKKLIESYKILIDNIFSRSKGILGDKFIVKLIKKAEKVTNNGEVSLLKGIGYSKNKLQLDLVYKNYSEKESTYTEKIVADCFNKILELINKALTMLVGSDSSLKILKDGLQDLIVNNKEIYETVNLEKNLPNFIS